MGQVDKFEFGRNWTNFLKVLDDGRIDQACRSLKTLTGKEDLTGLRFLDAGSGSGLFSLAAFRLGAEVVSFDADSESVACTRQLFDRFAGGSDRWKVLSGSLLDEHFLNTIGPVDIAYCWGVLHHTGAMWQAFELLLPSVMDGGLLVVALYNDQGYVSRKWAVAKRVYQRLPGLLRPVYVSGFCVSQVLHRLFVTGLASVIRLLSARNPFVPFQNWASDRQDRSRRGMHFWYDQVDWIGGWPFEVARVEQVFRFLRDRRFELVDLTTCDGHGCNEFVARRLKVDCV